MTKALQNAFNIGLNLAYNYWAGLKHSQLNNLRPRDHGKQGSPCLNNIFLPKKTGEEPHERGPRQTDRHLRWLSLKRAVFYIWINSLLSDCTEYSTNIFCDIPCQKFIIHYIETSGVWDHQESCNCVLAGHQDKTQFVKINRDTTNLNM